MKRPNPATGNPFESGEYILDSDWETKLWFRGYRKDVIKNSLHYQKEKVNLLRA